MDEVFISSPDGSLHIYEEPQFSTDFDSVVQGDLMTVDIPDLGFTPTGGEIYTVNAYTTRGVGDTYQVVA